MARQVRIRVSGGMYHVFTRGHNRERILCVVLGGERFARKVRGRLAISPQSKGQRDLGTRRTFAEIVRLVERIKEEPWGAFRDRYGDWGRDLALWAGRR